MFIINIRYYTDGVLLLIKHLFKSKNFAPSNGDQGKFSQFMWDDNKLLSFHYKIKKLSKNNLFYENDAIEFVIN